MTSPPGEQHAEPDEKPERQRRRHHRHSASLRPHELRRAGSQAPWWFPLWAPAAAPGRTRPRWRSGRRVAGASALVTAWSSRSGDRRSHPPHRRDRIREAFGDDRLSGRPGIGRLAGQHLVDHTAQAVHVGPTVDLARAARLLGRHVGGGPHGHAGLGEALPAGLSSARAIPKSATSACPPLSRMFSGLMSRWITPWPWA